MALCLAMLCLWQMAQLDETRARLREEIQLKYEYSAVIDSLLAEEEAAGLQSTAWLGPAGSTPHKCTGPRPLAAGGGLNE